MKRLLISFSVFCILLCYTYFSEKYVFKFCNEIDQLLENCVTEIKEEKYSQAKGSVSKLLNKWEDSDIILTVFIGDTVVTEPEKSIRTAYRCLEDENYDYCLAFLRECQGYIHELTETNNTNIGTIL